MINASEAREDDETFKNPVDVMFDELEARDPDHFAVKQYRKYKLAAGVVCSKLHQNYLRRKASGAQKAWEKRYNAKRKAQIEAAKAAIREEDISNGVFIPVGQLPQQVPQKAPVQAHAAV